MNKPLQLNPQHNLANNCLERDVTITLSPREDGGLRVFSNEVPGLILSGSNPKAVMDDVWPALTVILAYKEKA